MSASWNKYFFIGIGQEVVQYWFDKQRMLKKSQKKLGARVLACNVVLNFKDGLARPHVLVSDPQQGSTVSYTVLAFSKITRWSKVVEFKVSKYLSPPSSTFKLLDGPCVIWSKGSFIYVACGSSMGITSLNISSIRPNLAIFYITIPWCKLEPDSPLVARVGVQVHLKEKIPGKEFEDREWFTGKIVLQDTPTLTMLTDTIPGCYGRIAACVADIREHFLDQWSREMEVRDGVVVGTELKQVLVLNNQTTVPPRVLTLGHVPRKLVTLTVRRCGV